MIGPAITTLKTFTTGLETFTTGPLHDLVLAQTPLNQGNIPHLPKAPLPARLLFENPWPLAIVLIVAGVAVLITMNRRSQAKRGLAISGALFAAAVAVWLTAHLVTTTREHLRARTFDLIGAVTRADLSRARELLEPEAVAYFPEAPTGPDGVRILDSITPIFSAQYRIREWAVLDQEATIDGPNTARTQFRVRLTAEEYGIPYLGWVRFNWRQEASGEWRVKSVEEIARNALGG